MIPAILPWKPEPLNTAKARLSAALTPDTDVRAAEIDLTKAPGVNRRNVFDLETGVRMVVSTDFDSKTNLRLVHLSFSFPHTSLAPDLRILHQLARQICTEFIGSKKVAVEKTTEKAIHFFFHP